MRSVIFDLDLTLVDTTICEQGRHEKNWPLVYSLIPQCAIYEGIEDVFSIIRKFGIKACIVSTSPRPYIEKMREQLDSKLSRCEAHKTTSSTNDESFGFDGRKCS